LPQSPQLAWQVRAMGAQEPASALELAVSSDSDLDLPPDACRPRAYPLHRGNALVVATVLFLAALAISGSVACSRSGGEQLTAATTALEEKAEVKQPVPDASTGFPTKKWWPTLFCWSVMNFKNAEEVRTIKGQVRNRTGIVGCDNFAVLSGRRMYLGKGHKLPNGSHVKVYSWLNPAHSVPMGDLAAGDHTNSYKNADIFIGAWNILVSSGGLWGHNWTVKVDPDAVFFAYRLRAHMKKWTWGTDAMYFKNCNMKGPRLYGALEVVNEAAMRKYEALGKGCQNLPWKGWGEDEWIDKCMRDVCKAQAKIDYKLVGDHRCMAAECDDIERTAYHDYKTEASYYDCWKRSKDAEKVKEGGYFCCTYGSDCNTCTSRQWPGKDFCGGSKAKCRQCGTQTKWCQKDSSAAEVVMK